MPKAVTPQEWFPLIVPKTVRSLQHRPVDREHLAQLLNRNSVQVKAAEEALIHIQRAKPLMLLVSCRQWQPAGALVEWLKQQQPQRNKKKKSKEFQGLTKKPVDLSCDKQGVNSRKEACFPNLNQTQARTEMEGKDGTFFGWTAMAGATAVADFPATAK